MGQERIVFGLDDDNKIKTDVFISYKRENAPFVKRVVQELVSHDISVWVDYDKLPDHIGEDYKARIHKGIDNAQIVLFIYSKATESSEFIIDDEIGYAHNHKKQICCYAHESVDFNNMKSQLAKSVRDIQWVGRKDDIASILKAQEAIKDEKKRRLLAQSINDISELSSEFQDINLFLIRIAVQKLLGHPTPYGKFDVIAKSSSIYANDGRSIEMIVENMCLKIDIPKDKLGVLNELKFVNIENDPKDEINRVMQVLEDKGIDKDTLITILKDFIHNEYKLNDIWEWLEKHYESLSLPNVKDFTVDDFISIVAQLTSDDFIREITENHKTMFNGAMLGVLGIQDFRTENDESHELSIKFYHSDYFTFKCTVKLYHILRSIDNKFDDIKTIIKVPIKKDMKQNIPRYAPFVCSLGMGGFVVIKQDGREVLMWARRSDAISSGDMWHFSYDETVNLLKDAVRNEEDGNVGDIIINPDGTITIDPYKNLYRALREENGILPNRTDLDCGIVSIGVITSERLEIELLSFAMIELDNSIPIAMQMRRFQHSASDGYLEISKLEFRDIYDSVNNYIGRLLTPESHYLAEYLQSNRTSLFSKHQIGDNVSIDKSVRLGKNVVIGNNTIIEEFTTLGDNTIVGHNCKIHRNVFVDEGVTIGNYVKIQNNNSIYNGVVLEDGVFVGTNVSFTNDRNPRSLNEDGTPVKSGDWKKECTIVRRGASIGAGAVIRCGVVIGEKAMVGCGAVITKDVPPYAVVVGPAAQILYYVD